MLALDNPSLAALVNARRIVLFSGAGISAESGVPTFRDDLSGLWAQYDPMELATLEAFRRQPELVWGWYEWRRQRVREALPNAAHETIAQWQADSAASIFCVTQNVDDLHERAGCAQVLHLHGDLFRSFCVECGVDYEPAVGQSGLDSGSAPGDGAIEPPRCSSCQGYIRPGVVWFGESLDSGHLHEAFEQSEHCDVLLAIGTSGVVQPAAALPSIARDAGAHVIQINPQETALDAVAHCNLRAPAAQALPALYEKLRQEQGRWS